MPDPHSPRDPRENLYRCENFDELSTLEALLRISSLQVSYDPLTSDEGTLTLWVMNINERSLCVRAKYSDDLPLPTRDSTHPRGEPVRIPAVNDARISPVYDPPPPYVSPSPPPVYHSLFPSSAQIPPSSAFPSSDPPSYESNGFPTPLSSASFHDDDDDDFQPFAFPVGPSSGNNDDDSEDPECGECSGLNTPEYDYIF